MSRPEVFTRERLVNRRQHEVSFLEKKLDEKFDPGIQGVRDVREFSGVIAHLRGNFDPVSGAASSLQVSNLQRQAEEAQIQHVTNMTLLQQQLAATRLNPATQPATQPGVFAPAPANGQAGLTLPATGPSDFAAFAGAPALPSPADAVTSSARPTAIERLRDEMAYRDFIQAALRERELDDTHDLGGNTLYTLKFDLTTLPGSDVEKFQTVRIEIQKPPKKNDDPKAAPAKKDADAKAGLDKKPSVDEGVRALFYAWRDRLRRDVTAEAIYLQRTYADDRPINDAQRIALADRISLSRRMVAYHLEEALAVKDWTDIEILKARSYPPDKQHWLEQLNTSLETTTAFAQVLEGRVNLYDAVFKADEKERPSLRELLCEIAQAKYEALSSTRQRARDGSEMTSEPLVFFGKPLKGFGPFEGYFLPAIDELGDRGEKKTAGLLKQVDIRRLAAFQTAIDALEDQAYVYSVEPKEYAQNISDVAATEKLRNIVVSLQALFPGAGVSGSGDLNTLYRSQERLQAILRKPLVVGYADGPRRFGWVLGPHFAIDDEGKVKYTHSPVQQSVQASLVVPGWLTQLKLKAVSVAEGKSDGNKVWTIDNGGDEDGTLVVRLPGDPTALTQAFLAARGAEWRIPQAYPRDPTLMYAGPLAPKQTLLVRGTDLWRNPQVFIGDARATVVEVLPDMRGVLATFDKLDMPPVAPGRSTAMRSITVITSGGLTVLPDAVTLLPAAASHGAAQAGLADTFALPGGTFRVQIDPATFPESFVNLGLRVRIAGQASPFIDVKPAFSVDARRSLITFTLPNEDRPADIYEADVRIKPTVQDDEQSLPLTGRKTFVLYAKGSSKPVADFEVNHDTITFDHDGKTADTGSILFPPDVGTARTRLFDDVHPELADALRDGQAELVLRGSLNTTSFRVKIVPAPAGATIDLASLLASGVVPKPEDATTADKTVELKATIEYPDSPAGPIEVAKPLKIVRKKP